MKFKSKWEKFLHRKKLALAKKGIHGIKAIGLAAREFKKKGGAIPVKAKKNPIRTVSDCAIMMVTQRKDGTYRAEARCNLCGKRDFYGYSDTKSAATKAALSKCLRCTHQGGISDGSVDNPRRPLVGDVERDYDESEGPFCPQCGGSAVPLGSLGNRQHYRCRDCGWDFSEVAEGNPQEEMYELFYSTGGHGGPYHSLVAAREAAVRLLKGNRNEEWIEIYPYSEWPGGRKSKAIERINNRGGMGVGRPWGSSNPEIRPRLRHGGSEVRPRLDYHPPSPVAHLGSRSPFKHRMRGTISNRSPLAGLKYNPNEICGIDYAANPLTASQLRVAKSLRKKYRGFDEGRLSGQAGANFMAAYNNLRRQGYSEEDAMREANEWAQESTGLKDFSAKMGNPGLLSKYKSKSPDPAMVKIYDHVTDLYCSGSVNSGTPGIKKSDQFHHPFKTKPSAYGIIKSGSYYLPQGAVVLKPKSGSTPLLKFYGKSSVLSQAEKTGSVSKSLKSSTKKE